MFTIKVNGEPVATLDVDPILVKSVKMKAGGGFETSVLQFHEDSVNIELEYRQETDLDVVEYRRTSLPVEDVVKTRRAKEEIDPNMEVKRVSKAQATKELKAEEKAEEKAEKEAAKAEEEAAKQ